jgi:hypothetical protein
MDTRNRPGLTAGLFDSVVCFQLRVVDKYRKPPERVWQSSRIGRLERAKPPTETVLSCRLVRGPSLLPTLAFEHADCAALLGIQHGSNESGLLTTMTAYSNWISFEAGKDFVFEFVVHG